MASNSVKFLQVQPTQLYKLHYIPSKNGQQFVSATDLSFFSTTPPLAVLVMTLLAARWHRRVVVDTDGVNSVGAPFPDDDGPAVSVRPVGTFCALTG